MLPSRLRIFSLRLALLAPPCLLGVVTASCAQPSSTGSAETVIAASDYAFQVPARFPKGPTRFRLRNDGKVPHELAMGQLRAGITADSVLARLASGGDPTDLTDGVVGVLIAEPGGSSLGSLGVELIQGRTYLMICQFKDADSLPPHIAMGMQASFVVD
jgi:hypothetical protein